ncbi:PhzF family phenazine biosynthesis protein [Aeromonas diversa]|uniref:PhzF family phenazine biosynthesis protein n=1 Tax=Aeromonas diversa TaxID=502790 RepID=UPI003461968D
MNLTVYQVDAFSRTPFGGNPAAVCITDQGLTPALMQAIAAEMAVSETAFLALDTGRLRWFTPEVEVELCGHGTLSVGAVLREQGMLGEGEGKTFETLSGPLSVSVQGEWLALDFPEQPATPCEPDSALLAALGIERSRVQCYAMNGPKVMVVVDEPALVEALAPDHVALRRLPGRGVVVSAPSADPAFDFISRYFSPWVGCEEDPVTGSAHCILAPYWGERLGRTRLMARQASHRGGELRLERKPNGRLAILGQAHVILKGELRLPSAAN